MVATAQPGGITMLRPLGVRDFRLVWIGETISMLGDGLYFVALAWLVLQLTGSGLALGALLSVAAVPRAAFMLLGGAITDRISPRLLMLGSNSIRAALMAILTLLVVAHMAQLWELYAIGFVFGTADAVFFPAANVVAPLLLDEERLPAGNALQQGSMQVTLLVGPAAAGLIIAFAGQVSGTSIAFGFDAVSFGFASLMLMLSRASSWDRTPAEKDSAREKESIFTSILAGLRYAWSDPAIRVMLITIAIIDNAFSGPFEVGIPVLAHQRYGAGAAGFGLVLAAWGLGGLAGNIIGGSLRHPRRRGWLTVALLGWIGVWLGLIGLTQNAAEGIVAAGLMGTGTGLINVLMVPWLQARTDPAMLGRVMSLIMFASMGLGPLSLIVAGGVVTLTLTGLLLGAGVMVIIGAIYAGSSKALREID
ncbi:MAG: MFS transporter [Chloroflexota bacterium]